MDGGRGRFGAGSVPDSGHASSPWRFLIGGTLQCTGTQILAADRGTPSRGRVDVGPPAPLIVPVQGSLASEPWTGNGALPDRRGRSHCEGGAIPPEELNQPCGPAHLTRMCVLVQMRHSSVGSTLDHKTTLALTRGGCLYLLYRVKVTISVAARYQTVTAIAPNRVQGQRKGSHDHAHRGGAGHQHPGPDAAHPAGCPACYTTASVRPFSRASVEWVACFFVWFSPSRGRGPPSAVPHLEDSLRCVCYPRSKQGATVGSWRTPLSGMTW